MAAKESYDLVIIGSGPGGYVAAVRAAQLGLKTACVEKEARLGGVCLNVGCIPSKALLDSSEYFHLAQTKLAEHGVKTGRVSLDLAVMLARKDKVVDDLTQNVRKLLERNKIDIISGLGRVAGPDRVEVTTGKSKPQVIATRSILLATGSAPMEVPGLAFDGERMVSSSEALKFDSVPKKLGIVGGGYIGLELGSVWMRLGAQVTVIEMLPRIAANLDSQVGRRLDRLLRRQGMAFRLQTKVSKAVVSGKKVQATLESKGASETLSFDRLLVSVGRRPLTQGLGLEEVGVAMDPNSGHVLVDTAYQTNVKGIYAIGDLVPGPMLAHKASAEGIAAVEGLAGRAGEVNYDTIPSVVYTLSLIHI